MFAIKLSMEKQIKVFWSAGFSDLPAINATVVKGHTISEWIYGVIVYPKMRKKDGQDFC